MAIGIVSDPNGVRPPGLTESIPSGVDGPRV